MQWNMSDEQFCNLLDWRHPVLAEIDAHLPTVDKALAAAAAIRRVTPRTLTIPARVPELLTIWQSDYPDDIASCRDLLERTVLDQAHAWQPDPANYAHINEKNLRHMMTHRHQAMVLASRLFALTGDRRYLGLSVGLIQAFVQQAPPCPDGSEPAWASWMAGYTGMDVVWASHVMENWLLALPLLQPHLADEDYLVFLKALACGADYHWNCWQHNFFHNYTRHGVRAAAGVGLALPMFKDARKWLQLGIDRFFGDMTSPPLCLDDGYTRESIGYEAVNAYVAAKWYLLCRTHGIAVPADYERRLQAMFDFAARIIKPDGSHPCQGESSPDSSHEHYILAHEMLHIGAALFDRPDWRAVAGSLNDDRLAPEWLWIVDPRLYAKWKEMPQANFAARAMLSGRGQSKFCTLRSGKGPDSLCVQTWALNPRNHGHHDALHLEVYGLGRTLVSDAGFASYAADCRQRDWQPQRHSSIHLVGMTQAAKQFYNDSYTREILWHEDETIAACGLESRLYLDYTVRRFVILLKADHVIAVVDTVCEDPAAPMPAAPFAGIETRFAFHTPVIAAGRDGLAMWSQHKPTASALLHQPTDTVLAGKDAQPFNWSDICRILGWGESDANVLIRPLLHQDLLAVCVRKDWLCVPGGIIPRPVALYTQAGPLPVLQAWEVQPFHGTGMPDFMLAAKAWSGGETVVASSTIRVHLAGLTSQSPSVNLVRSHGHV
jgi:hypothetical protein